MSETTAGVTFDPSAPGQAALWEAANAMIDAAKTLGCAASMVHLDIEAGTATVTVTL